jgi:hypothetical protein
MLAKLHELVGREVANQYSKAPTLSKTFTKKKTKPHIKAAKHHFFAFWDFSQAVAYCPWA